MAGLERSRFVNAQPDLFTGSSMLLMKGPDTDIQLLDRLKAFFTDVGFDPPCRGGCQEPLLLRRAARGDGP